LKEEDRKDEVTKVNEKERSSEEEVIRMMIPSFSLPLSLLSLSHPHHLSILHSFQSATSLPLLFPVILSSTSLPLSF
jgi:hypothetical protein